MARTLHIDPIIVLNERDTLRRQIREAVVIVIAEQMSGALEDIDE